MTNVPRFFLFDICSAFWPANFLNHRCACATMHGLAMGGWSHVKGRMASREEFLNLRQHDRVLSAGLPPATNKKRRLKNGRANGPRGREDRGKVFCALPRSNYPGTVLLLVPEREGCWG